MAAIISGTRERCVAGAMGMKLSRPRGQDIIVIAELVNVMPPAVAPAEDIAKIPPRLNPWHRYEEPGNQIASHIHYFRA